MPNEWEDATTMDYTTTLQALRAMRVETGSLVCWGCGHEHSCGIHGCAILRNAVGHMEAALAQYDHLNALLDQKERDIKMYVKYLAASEEARSDLARRLAAARQRMDGLAKK